MRHNTRWLSVFLMSIAQLAASGAAHGAVAKSFDPKADRLLMQMSQYLSGLQSFKVKAQSTTQAILKGGQRLSYLATTEVAVQRPGSVSAGRTGVEEKSVSLVSDGKQLTVFDQETGKYSTLPAPKTLDALFDYLTSKTDLDVPGSDVLSGDAYAALTDDSVSGKYVDQVQIDGRTCNHLAFRGHQTDWEIWIRDGSEPLPAKLTIVTKDVKGDPQFTLDFSDWDTSAKFSANTFKFVPPPGAERVATIDAATAGGKS